MSFIKDEKHVACSLQKHIILKEPFQENQILLVVYNFIDVLIKGLKENGCKMIGHIKGMVDCGENGILFFNITSYDDEVRVKGV